MKELILKVSTRDENIAGEIMKELAKYDCNYNIVKEESSNKYTYMYQNLPYTRLGDITNRTNEQYRKDMNYYNSVGNILLSYGIKSNHKGFKYAIECIRLMNTYGIDNYSMTEDVYPVVSKWYNVTATSVEHNIRNAINNSWQNYSEDTSHYCDMKVFSRRPTNRKFLKHIAKITSYLIAESY